MALRGLKTWAFLALRRGPSWPYDMGLPDLKTGAAETKTGCHAIGDTEDREAQKEEALEDRL